ncbi:MAG: beta-propeller fold lactonase family protein [Verrucomicrobiales bacterium]|nr:beta-propeller fold lactonase family protein [Verrucomicrobiales bacterium]
MINLLRLLPIFFLFGKAECGQTVAVSAGGKLTVFRVTESQLLEAQSIELGGASGPFEMSPDRKLLYINTSLAGEEKPVPALATFAIGKDGLLEHIHTAASGWNSGYLSSDATGKFLAGNSYRNGVVGIWRLEADGIYRGAEPMVFDLEKKAHSAVFSPDNRFLYVPATGPNKIFQLVFNSDTGALHPNQPSSAPGPKAETDARQPRHIILHPEIDIAYTTNEREMAGVGVWQFDREKGLLESVHGIPSVAGDGEGMTTADLHLSVDSRFLFVSNRDIKNRKAAQGRDAIAVFAVNEKTGELSFVKRFPCERIPRSFAVGLEGKLLFVGGQGDNKLGVYRIDEANGHLSKLETHGLPGSPGWVFVIPAD